MNETAVLKPIELIPWERSKRYMPQENKDGAGAEGKEKNLDQPEAGAGVAGAGAGEGADGKPAGEGQGADETVTLPKAEVERLKKVEADNDNYQKALGIGKYKKEKTVVEPGASQASTTDESKFVTKDEVYKKNQKAAIKIATTVDKNDDSETAKIKKDLDDHWDDIKAFYTPRKGKDSAEDIVEDLYDAHAVWARKNSGKGADGKSARADIGADRGTGGSSPARGAAPRKSILPKNVAPKDWYPKKSA